MTLVAALCLATVMASAQPQGNAAEGPNPTVDGYRGIWFTIKQGHEYGDKYSGGLGTYTMKHIPMAVYSPEADKTFFVYGGAPNDKELYLQCMIGCYDHATGDVIFYAHEAFQKAMKEGREFDTPLSDGMSALIYSLAAKESSETQTTVHVPDWGKE